MLEFVEVEARLDRTVEGLSWASLVITHFVMLGWAGVAVASHVQAQPQVEHLQRPARLEIWITCGRHPLHRAGTAMGRTSPEASAPRDMDHPAPFVHCPYFAYRVPGLGW